MRSKILGVLVLVLMIANLYMIFVFAPNEATMGVIQRIFYFHLPFGVSSYLSAYLLGFASIMYLIKHDLKWDRLGASAGEMGILFTSMSIMSGALWAKPVWGIWWTWDARLTLQFLLGLIFLSYLMLRAYLPELEKKAASRKNSTSLSNAIKKNLEGTIPLLAEEGWLRRAKRGADGVARSASPAGRSLNRRPATALRRCVSGLRRRLHLAPFPGGPIFRFFNSFTPSHATPLPV